MPSEPLSPQVAIGPDIVHMNSAEGVPGECKLKPLPILPAAYKASFERKQTLWPPQVFKVYYIPSRDNVAPKSMIHSQKRDGGFFSHPVLVVASDSNSRTVEFYAITSYPPKAINELGIFLRLGTDSTEVAPDTLKLAMNSDRMPRSSFVNLDQRFTIEWDFLDEMRGNLDVHVDPEERKKLDAKICQLEAQQNRFIYKPLPANFSGVAPGTVVMISNPPSSNTFGAPVLILTNNFPHFRFLRVKLQADNSTFGLEGPSKYKIAQIYCLKLAQIHEDDSDEKPVLLFEPDSPALRHPSYVEVTTEVKIAHADQLKTWCVPPVKIQQSSLNKLWKYMETLPQLRGSTQPREHYRSLSPALPATRGLVGTGAFPHKQQGYDLRLHHQRQRHDLPLRNPLGDNSNAANRAARRNRPDLSLQGLPRRQPMGEISGNAASSFQQSSMSSGMMPPSFSPAINHTPHTWPMFFPGYYYNPNYGYIPLQSPVSPFFPDGTNGYGYGSGAVQPYYSPTLVTPDDPARRQNAQLSQPGAYQTTQFSQFTPDGRRLMKRPHLPDQYDQSFAYHANHGW